MLGLGDPEVENDPQRMADARGEYEAISDIATLWEDPSSTHPR